MAGQDDELRALCSRLNGMALKPSDRQKLLDEIGMEMETQTDFRIAELKKSPDGNDWKNITAATEQFYRKHGIKPGRKWLLYQEGYLARSITHEKDNLSVIVGATAEYAALHQFGGEVYPFGNKKAKKVKVEARPYLGLSTDDKAEVAAIINGFLSGIGK